MRRPCSSLEPPPAPSRPRRWGTRAGEPLRSWSGPVDGGSYRRGRCRQGVDARQVLPALQLALQAREGIGELLLGLSDLVFRVLSLQPHANPVDGGEEVVVREGHPSACRRPPFGILRHQLGRVVNLVQVLVDYVRFSGLCRTSPLRSSRNFAEFG